MIRWETSKPVSSALARNPARSPSGSGAKITRLLPLLALVSLFCLPPVSHAQEETRRVAGGNAKQRTAIFAGGCFWCIEKDFEKAPGVIDVVSGYTGGTSKNPTYKTYTGGRHREAVMVTYDPAKVTFAGLVEFLIKHIDPVDKRGSFIDRGVQYSPAIYFEDEQEKEAAERVIKAINAMKVYRAPISMAIVPRSEFYPAEEYHQDFHVKNEAKYNLYRTQCGRDRFVKSVWGDRANELTLPGAYPEGVQPPAAPPK
ncbi:MAG: peptide-methionine (S)-S-oxide reductase MsrA [Planctomycetota bacterium]